MTPSRIVSPIALLAALGAGSACHPATAPQAAAPLVLQTGAYTAIWSSFVVAKIDTVENDSRCPSNVVCVWAGNAAVVVAVHIGTTPGPDAHVTLNTGIEPRSAVVSGYRITLDSLTPYPAGQPIPQSSYRAYVSVVSLPDA